jgi:hypothetical protein
LFSVPTYQQLAPLLIAPLQHTYPAKLDNNNPAGQDSKDLIVIARKIVLLPTTIITSWREDLVDKIAKISQQIPMPVAHPGLAKPYRS